MEVVRSRKRSLLYVPMGMVKDGKPFLRKDKESGLYYWYVAVRPPMNYTEMLDVEMRDGLRHMNRTLALNMYGDGGSYGIKSKSQNQP